MENTTKKDKRMFDILVKDCCALTMDGSRRVLPRCSIGIKDGKIAAIGESIGGEALKTIDGSSCYALPGFVNTHTHVYQALIEGVGYDMHFNPWNIRYLIPIISRMGPRHARFSSELAAIEMIKSGTTAFSDHWYLHTDFENIEEVAEGFAAAGLRSHLVFGFLNESFAGRKNSGGHSDDVLREDGELLAKAESFVLRRHGRGLVTVGLGPGSTEDVGRDFFLKIIALAKKLDVAPVTHIAGWVEIVSRSLEKYQMRDLEYAHSLGFTGSKAIAIHGVWLSGDEIKIAAETGTSVAHNPVANMHLGYGIAPIPEMLDAGVKVGLGTDGAASYTYDMLEVAKTAAMLQKVRKLDAEALTAETALGLLTNSGAAVLGMEKQVGSLDLGKQADIILLRHGEAHFLSKGRPAPSILYSARGSDVVHSIIDGKLVMENRKVLTLDEEKVLAQAHQAREELFALGGEATKALIDAPWPSKGASWRRKHG
jgi:5-methylthioadenosine/S-adenosylhomocysteine deaminase